MTTAKGAQSATVIADSVYQRINATLPLKDNVVLSLTQAADSLTGLRRRELMRLSDRVAFVENAEVVLRDARLLELFQPLATAQHDLAQAEDRTRQCEVERRVFQVLQRPARQTRATSERWSVLIYPLLVLLLSTLVFAFISIVITPVFEQMFFEFGLTLPTPTRLVISISHIMQSVWFWLLFAVLVMLLAVMLGIRALDSLRWLISGSVDSWLSAGYSKRRSLGDLAWHTALLLDVGQGVETSVEIAGAASRNAAMRQGAPHLARHFGLANLALNPQRSPLVAPQQQTAANWYLGVPCHLLTHALNIRQEGIEQSAMLREVANLYWDRELTKSVWILSWLQPVAVSMIGLVVSFVVLALFMPLVELITGLT
jgi:hypothetical protein